MNNNPATVDTVSVHVKETEEITADGVKLYVSLSSSSLFSGQQAMKKAKEVASLVTELLDCGVEEEEIELLNISAEVAKGVISRSSSARYSLRISCKDLDLFPSVLSVITSRKQLELQKTEWSYSNLVSMQDAMLARAMSHVSKRANLIAESMKLSLLGVHSFKENFIDPEAHHVSEPYLKMGMNRERASADIDLGMQIAHRKLLHLDLHVDYRVSAL